MSVFFPTHLLPSLVRGLFTNGFDRSQGASFQRRSPIVLSNAVLDLDERITLDLYRFDVNDTTGAFVIDSEDGSETYTFTPGTVATGLVVDSEDGSETFTRAFTLI